MTGRGRIGLAAAAMLTGCYGGAREDRARDRGTPEAGYVVARPEHVDTIVELPGRTSAFEVSEVRPQVTGVILARRFEEGSVVRAGQTLYQIDASLYQAAAEQAEANLAAAAANRRAAAARSERLAPLVRINAVSRQEFVDASAAADQTAAAVRQQQASLKTARINLRFTRVPAPITGRIGRSLATTGALVTANQTAPMATIQRLDPIFVDVQQSGTDLLSLRGGRQAAAARLVLPDGSLYPLAGTLKFAEAVVDPASGAVTLRASFPNPDGALLPGMYVRARLPRGAVDGAFLVPQQAVSRDPRGRGTVLLAVGGKAVEREVATAGTRLDRWIVTSGLTAGDRVIVEGLGRIRAGGSIKAVPAGSRPARRRPGGPRRSEG